jgi:hypothetical protein
MDKVRQKLPVSEVMVQLNQKLQGFTDMMQLLKGNGTLDTFYKVSG